MFVEGGGGACATAQWHNGQSKPDSQQRGWASINFFTSVGAVEVDMFECLALTLQCIGIVSTTDGYNYDLPLLFFAINSAMDQFSYFFHC